MNLVCIDGRLTKDTEVKMFENSDKKIVEFAIANQRDKDHSDYINCKAWDSNADFINKYFKKGDGINITGELRINKYTNKDGENRYETYVLVRQVGFPLQKPKEQGQTTQTTAQNTGIEQWDAGKNIEIDQDGLPFY